MTSGIYSFRGADIQNIINFEKDFPGTKIIKLEQNYRCTGNILDVANGVIKNNPKKYEKKLWTKNNYGKKPQIFKAEDEYDEARYIVEQIHRLRREEYYKYNDFAVLYRMNTQSRAIEDIFRREDIPYKIVGGLKFYERKEIKDIIAYLRLIENPNHNMSLIRVINEPKRGVGKTSLDEVQNIAQENNISMYEVVKNADTYSLNRVFANTRRFVEVIEDLIKEKNSVLLSDFIKKVLKDTGYMKALKEENSKEAENRIANLEEFLTVAVEFENEIAENSLQNFLESITLSSDIDGLNEGEDAVTLMTLHSAKGLEYPVIFMVGMEEGVFPGYRSIGEEKELEEERRLCYVGITRAKENLFFTCAKQRSVFGSTSYNAISRFINEMPAELIDGVQESEVGSGKEDFKESTYKWEYSANKGKSSYAFRSAESFLNDLAKTKPKIDLSMYEVGQRVYHKKFGEGKIIKIEEEGNDYKLDINFDKSGHKRLMARYAGLEVRS